MEENQQEENYMDHSMKAAELFMEGRNCAQAVLLAFNDVTGLDEHLAAKISGGFGGGFGRLREVCGAVSGMVMVAGLLYGYDENGAKDAHKKDHYALIQELIGQFREEVGNIVCRDILKNPPSDPNPSPRTAEYYAQRPCVRMVMTAARILDAYIAEHPVA